MRIVPEDFFGRRYCTHGDSPIKNARTLRPKVAWTSDSSDRVIGGLFFTPSFQLEHPLLLTSTPLPFHIPSTPGYYLCVSATPAPHIFFFRLDYHCILLPASRLHFFFYFYSTSLYYTRVGKWHKGGDPYHKGTLADPSLNYAAHAT